MNNFTPRAQQVLALARKEADRFNHSYVGTEHLLLGLIKLGQGVAVNVLERMGLDLETVRMEVEKEVGTGSGLTYLLEVRAGLGDLPDWKLTFGVIFCGASKSLFGSASASVGNCPTQNVRMSEMPDLARKRSWCSPRAQSGAMVTVAVTFLASVTLRFLVDRPLV